MRKFWTDSEIKFLKEQYPIRYAKDVASELKRSERSIYSMVQILGIKKDEEFLKSELQNQARRLKRDGAKYRFSKGHTPFNKGQKMPDEIYQKAKGTMFKKGNKPHNAIPDGGEVLRHDKNGKDYLMIKVKGEKKLKYKHIHIWEQKHGKIQRGFNIVFKDGNQMNCTIDNLECLSNAELMRRNTIQRFPKELISTIKLASKLKKQIYAKEQN